MSMVTRTTRVVRRQSTTVAKDGNETVSTTTTTTTTGDGPADPAVDEAFKEMDGAFAEMDGIFESAQKYLWDPMGRVCERLRRAGDRLAGRPQPPADPPAEPKR